MQIVVFGSDLKEQVEINKGYCDLIKTKDNIGMSYFKCNRLSNATVRPKFFLSFIYKNSNIQAAHKLFFLVFIGSFAKGLS